MKTTPRKLITIAALMMFAVLQVGLQIGFAGPSSPVGVSLPIVPQLVGRLTTRNNKPILVNGISAANGASIATGATLETKQDEAATVELGTLGRVEIGANTKIILTFDESSQIRVLIMYGCATLTANKSVKGELATDKGLLASTDPAIGGILQVNFPQGAAAPILGATCDGGGAGAAAAAGGAGGLFGLGLPATIAVLAGAGAAALTPLFVQTNPSP